VTRTVTLQTIADEIGVSRATVSNAYNRPDQLSAGLRERILAAATRLGYPGPDPAARMLRTGRRGAIGLLFSEDLRTVFDDPDSALFIRGVTEAATDAGTVLTLIPVPVGVDPATSGVASSAVDGYLVFSVPDDHPALAMVLEQQVPIVLVDEPDLGRHHSFVGIDDRAGARAAAAHIVALGHSRIGAIVMRLGHRDQPGPVASREIGQSTIRIVRERWAGYTDELEAAEIATDTVPVWEAGANDPDRGRDAAFDLLTAHPEITALLCFSDQLAIGASQGAAALGRRVPEDVSIVGFDDIPRATTWDPPLTTVSQPLVDKGRVAAELLMEGTRTGRARRVDLPIGLVVRESTAPPTTPS